MKARKKQIKNKLRRRSLNWSSLISFLKISKPKIKLLEITKKKKITIFRIKYWKKSNILITARRFRTSRNIRSKKNKQVVIPIYFLKTKELSIKKDGKKKTKKTPKIYTFTLTIKLNPQKITSNLVIVVGLMGLLFFGYKTIFPPKINLAPEQATTNSVPTPEPINDYAKPMSLQRSKPLKIIIPKINVETSAETVGRQPDGTMQTPDVFANTVGWYKYSPTPGEIGPSIIVGHVDSYKGPSIFWRLRELKTNDIIKISRQDGTVAKFKVNSINQFDQTKFPSDKVYGNINHAGLRLITCGGIFNHSKGHYSQNTVVFASLVSSS